MAGQMGICNDLGYPIGGNTDERRKERGGFAPQEYLIATFRGVVEIS
jgi:hypothetical protein